MEWFAISLLAGVFILLITIGLPISFAIALASLSALLSVIPSEAALQLITQKLASSLDSFTLLAIPFFILAGNIMNNGGIARRLINFAQLLTGRLPGSLTHCNIMANMMFGAISGSAVASAAAVGSVMTQVQREQNYDPAFCAACNITSSPSGLLIPPSNTLIIYSLVSGGTSISALFLAGYIPGILMGLSLMIVSSIISARRKYPRGITPKLSDVIAISSAAIPSLLLIIIIMGGIGFGIVTPTEASATAVIYSLILSMIVYREINWRQLPSILMESATTTAIVMLLIGASMGMSWVMAYCEIPALIASTLRDISNNPVIILLLINITLLLIGTFMDMTPALLIFTPIFLPIAKSLGVDPIHFGIIINFNLCIGICTPPVGNALFVGSSIANVPVQDVIRQILPFYLVLFAVLMVVTFIPQLSLFIPSQLGY